MDDTERKEHRAQQFRLLTQTSPDTEMGCFMRRFWHPVALSKDVAPGKAMPLKVLGEELTLYRGESGKPYIIAGRCAHRRTLLYTGWVQGELLRCIYHGWQYNGTGQCVHRPAEKDAGLPPVKVGGYAVHEYCGMVFAYLGEGAAPEFELPRKHCFEGEGVVTVAGRERWETNWFQQIENSLDATHVSFVHQKFYAGPFGQAVTGAVPEKLEYQETSAGIHQRATRAHNNVRESDWTFPNNNHIVVPGLEKDDSWTDIGVWMTPADDMNTNRFLLYATTPKTEDYRRRFLEHFEKYATYHPADYHDELFAGIPPEPENMLVGLTAAQDYVAMRGQGRITDRENEQLGKSDLGIITLRRIFWRELQLQREGKPMKDWRRLPEKPVLPTQPGMQAATT
jgi:phenylpropionate dioxygenase-like ring-hydroxylating dioxygenase large terminal subunit